MTDESTDEGVVRRDRFSGGPARSFLSSMDADERIFTADIAVDRAHVVMLEETDVIERSEATEILAALDRIESAGFEALPRAEDVHEAIETAVIDRVGEGGGVMHTARSRNDEVATCIRYRLRDDVLDLVEGTIELRETTGSVAQSHAETVMPGFTHLQSAQPTTVGHWALSYGYAIGRDTDRLLDAFDRINRSPLGAAAFAGTPFPIDRERTASLLGFDGVVENSMDAVSTRDFLLETTSALSILTTTLSGLAEDLVLFNTLGYVELDDDYASTSSIMPQKKNPDTLELLRASAGDIAGSVVSIHSILKGLPRAYNRDLQRITPHIWSAVDDAMDALVVANGVLATSEWNESVLTEAAGSNFATATGVADHLAASGVPFRTAHEIVAIAAEEGGDRAAIESATERILGEPIDSFGDLDRIAELMEASTSVRSRDSAGGPAPAAVATQIDSLESDLDADRSTLAERRTAIGHAEEMRSEVIDRYV